MKLKVLIAVLVVLVVILTTAYLLPSSPGKIKKSISLKTTTNAAYKFISQSGNWAKWWPESQMQAGHTNTFTYKSADFTIKKTMFNSVNIDITYENKVYPSLLTILPLDTDSLLLGWETEINSNRNLVEKIFSSTESSSLSNSMGSILDALKNFLENSQKVYEMDIAQIKVTDTVLISTRFLSVQYPDNQIIYQKIQELEAYVHKQKAAQTNPPMLHVKHDGNVYYTIIALPINHTIEESRKFVIKRMVPGKILVTEVSGGLNKTGKAMKQLELFMHDHKLSSPAIPFESLITNRIEQPDSSKWITKLYYPIY